MSVGAAQLLERKAVESKVVSEQQAGEPQSGLMFLLLLDVDDCAAMSNNHYGDHRGGYRYNDVLFDALLAFQIKELYLFTSYTLSGVAKNLEDEPISAPSRLKLIRYLEKKGFVVHGCITLLDAVYGQGVGAYYERVVKPFESYVLQGEDLKTGTNSKEYAELCKQDIEFRVKGDKTGVTSKAKLFEYLVQQESRGELAGQVGRAREYAGGAKRAYIFADDRKAYLESVWTMNQTACHRSLLTLLVEPLRTAESYKQELKPFIEMSQQAMLRYSNHDTDAARLELESAILKLCEPHHSPQQDPSPQDPSKPQVPLFGLDEIRYVSLETARKILSQDAEGRDVKQNALGNSLVTHLEPVPVFFKRPLNTPLIEECVYQTNRVLGGGIVTPTRLLYLKMPEGTYAFQASLAVGEVGFDEILRLPSGIQNLRKLLGEEELIAALPDLTSGAYIQNWFAKHQKYSADATWETQARILLEAMYRLPLSQWPNELRNPRVNKATCERFTQKLRSDQSHLSGLDLQAALEAMFRREDEKALFENKGLKSKDLFALLALLERYPQLTAGADLADLIHIPALFTLLRVLYPKRGDLAQNPKTILEHAEQILKHINRRHLCQHVLLALFTEPHDHKGDNFRVRIRHDAEGDLLPLEIVAIDNDDAMNGCFKRFKPLGDATSQNMVLLKTIFLCFGELLESPLDRTLCEEFLSLNPEVILLQWLSSVAKYYQTQAGLLKQAPALFSELNLHQFPSGFIQRFLGRLERIQAYLKTHRNVTVKEFLFAVEPILSRYYFELSHRYGDPQSVLMQIYKKEAPTVESVNDAVADGKEQKEQHEMLPLLPASPKRKAAQSFLEQVMDFIQVKYGPQYSAAPVLQKELFYLMLIYNQCSQKKFPLEEWALSDEVLVQNYFRAPEACISFLKQDCKKVILRLGERTAGSPVANLPLTEPRILFQVLNSPHEAGLLEILMALGTNPHLRREDGYTVLHLAARYNRFLAIPVLVHAAESLLEEPDSAGRTPLDLALQYEHFESVRQLLKLGGGRNIRVEQGRNFIQRYRETEPSLCAQVLRLNLELAWNLGIESISQVERTPEGVCLEGSGGLRFLKSEYYQKIFKGKEGFPKEDPYGRHNVTSFPCRIDHKIEVGFHLKENPKLPGREIMVHLLAKRLFGYITPPAALWKFSKEEGWWNKYRVAYPVLASRTVAGRNLHQILHETPELLTRIERQSFSEAVALAMLINPADGKFDNYMLEPFYLGETEHYRLVSIDNDFSFVRPIQFKSNGEEVEGPLSLQVKTVLYCMDIMQEPIHPQVRRRLLNLNVQDFIKLWLEELQAYQNKLKKLFDEKERKDLHEKDIYLEVAFKPSIVGDLYQKLKRMQQVLKKVPQVSLLQLLSRVIPELGARYGKTFTQFSTPKERFDFLTEGCFETRVMKLPKGENTLNHSISKLSALNIMQMTTDKKLSAEEFALEQEEGPEAALARLKSIEEDYARLKNVQEDLRFGKFEHFLKLLTDQQEMVLNGKGFLAIPIFDFALLKKQDGSPDLDRQRQVLFVIKGLPFRRLRLLNCDALTDESLSQLLQPRKNQMPLQNLTALELRGCRNLSIRALISVSLFCPNLEKLFIQGIPQLQIVSGITFPKLRVLYIYDCENLKEWLPNSIPLQRFNLKNCKALTKINKNLPILNSLRVENCDKLPGPAFLFYQQYPQLLRLPLEKREQNFVEVLSTRIEAICLKEGFHRNYLPETACQWWEKTFASWEASIKGISEKELTQSLLALLKDRDKVVGARASEALGCVQNPHELQSAAVETLLALLKTKEWYVRASASQALGRVQIPDKLQKVVAGSLFALLKDRDKVVRARASEALGCVQNPHELQSAAVESLLALLTDGDEDVREIASVALGRVQIPPGLQKVVVESLLALLKAKVWYVRASATEALGRVQIPSELQKVVVESLLALSKDEDWCVRASASESLGRVPILPELQEMAVESLLALLKDGDWDVTVSASEALCRVAEKHELHKVAVQLLLALSKHEDWYVRASASEALSKVQMPSEFQKVAVESLLALLKDQEMHVRERASMALGHVQISSELRKVAVESLLALSKDQERSVRAHAIEALGRVQNSFELQKVAVELLLALLKDESGNVRASASETLGKVHIGVDMLKQVCETLVTLLKHDDKTFRIKVITIFCSLLSPHYLLTQLSFWLKQNHSRQEQPLQNSNVLQVVQGLSVHPAEKGRLLDIHAAAATITDSQYSPSLALEVKGLKENEALLFYKAANAAGAGIAASSEIKDQPSNPKQETFNKKV